MRKLKLKPKGKKFSTRIRETFNQQTKHKMEKQEEVKLKHFQLALSMVGISANLMTCELIQSISAKCNEMGESFNIGMANKLANDIAEKYAQGQPPMMPPGMKPPTNLPPELQDMINKGHVMMGAKQPQTPQPTVDTPHTEIPDGPIPPAQ